jgi:hypothetical protein
MADSFVKDLLAPKDDQGDRAGIGLPRYSLVE